MDLVLIEQIGSVVFQALEAGIKYGPAIIADLRLAFSLATSGTTLTDEQKLSAETAVQNAHAELQAKLAADLDADTKAAVTQ